MQRIKSIVSSGTQYIDTGIKPTGNTKVVFDFCAYDQTTAQQALFGARPGDTNRFTVFTGYSNSSFQADYNTYKTLADETVNYSWIDTTRRMVLEMSNALVVNGTTVATVDKISFTSTYSMYLFANNVAGTPQTYGKLRLYSCQIYDNGTLVRDYVPCLDDSGVVCLYDTVESKYYYNAGTGSFTAGYPPVMFKRRPLIELAHEAAVTITGTGQTSRCYVTIGGTKYTTATTGLSVMTGDTITCTVNIPSGAGTAGSTVTLNGAVIFTSSSGSASGGGSGFPGSTSSTTSSYPWVVPKGTKTISIALTVGSSSSKASSIAITTT